jgi:hypothetical protein
MVWNIERPAAQFREVTVIDLNILSFTFKPSLPFQRTREQ